MHRTEDDWLDPAWDWHALRREPRAMWPNSVMEQVVPTEERLYFPMGQPCLLQTNDTALLLAADETYGRFARVRPAPGPPLLFRLFVHDPGAAPDCTHQPVVYRTHGDLLYVSCGAGSTAVADLVRGRAFGFVTPAVASNAALVRYAFLDSVILSLLCTARGFAGYHAACVVKGEQSAILCGDAGAGKSTLAFACVRRGYRVLAEDGLFFRMVDGHPRLWGMPWHLHLLPDSKDLFPELAGEEPRLQVNGEWKLEVDPERYYPGSTATDAEAGIVLILERDGGSSPTRIDPIAPALARERLQEQWPWWVGWSDEIEWGIERLYAGGAYRLQMNGSPSQAVDALDALLAEPGRVHP